MSERRSLNLIDTGGRREFTGFDEDTEHFECCQGRDISGAQIEQTVGRCYLGGPHRFRRGKWRKFSSVYQGLPRAIERIDSDVPR